MSARDDYPAGFCKAPGVHVSGEQYEAMWGAIDVAQAKVAAALPDCPRCGGTGTVRCDSCSGALVSCPDCVDGKVSVEQLVATWQAVHGEQAFVSYPLDDLKGGLLDAFDLGVDRAFAALRLVRSPSPEATP